MQPPQTSNGGPPERSDASGLVQADDGQWFDANPANEPAAPDGAPPVLALPRADQPDQPRRSDASQLIEPENSLGEPPPPPVAGEDHRREVPDIVPPFLPFGFPGGRPGERDRPQRSKAGEALEEDSPWIPEDAVAPEGVEPPTDHGDEMPDDDEGFDDRVPVVRTEDSDDDFASWDSEMLPWGGGGDSDAEPSDDAPEAWGSLEWQDEAPEPDADVPVSPGYAAWRPSRVTAESRAAALAADRPLMSGGPELSEEELQKLWDERDEETRQRELERRRAAGELIDEDEDDDEADEDESKDDRQAVNLLHQDDQAWGGNAADSGVIG
jgi:hypothetical protein